MAQSADDVEVIDSCGNVFVDLGFPAEEAEIHALRSGSMNRLEITLRERGWTPEETAGHLNIGRTRAAELMRGQWQNFSLDSLIALAARAGLKTRLEFAEAES